MEHNFWIERWQNKQIGFHNSDFHPLLTKHFHHLNHKENETIFIPLCGKTLDMKWLKSIGLNIIGCELVETAVIEFFDELKIKPNISKIENFTIYEIPQIKIFVGDIFKLNSSNVSDVNYIFDRGSLVALPEDMRQNYTCHLKKIAPEAKHLLITFEYDQSKISGPPFSVEEAELNVHYNNYQRILLETVNLENGMKGMTSATEKAWLISPNK